MSNSASPTFESLPPRPQERILIDLLPEQVPARMLCTSVGVAQLARAAAERYSGALVHCHYIDLFHAEQARQARGCPPSNLTIGCQADPPEEEIDLAALPFSAQGEAELVRDLLQAACLRLRPGGLLLASTDNPNDTWLQAELQKFFPSVSRRRADDAAAYVARKVQSPGKIKNYSCEFALRDRGTLLRVVSRPGVFAHRRVDAGARQLINAMEILPGERILEIGCGSGVASLAAAVRASGVHVHAVDCNARAVECTAAGVRLNRFENVTTELNAQGDYQGAGTYDLVLANPPYYAGFQIARRFLTAGHAALRLGGRILLVTKSPDWYAEHASEWFEAIGIDESKGYFLIHGRRAEEPTAQ